MTLEYTRNKHACAIDREDGTILARAGVDETFFAARVEMIIRTPGLEIVSISGDMERVFLAGCRDTVPLLQQAVGLRVGPGIIKLTKSLAGGPGGCPRLVDLILECCDQAILYLTLGPLKEILAKKGDELIEAHKNFLRQNPRLVNSCIAFAEGSPLREGVVIED